jgi:hypothetical protein
MACVGIAAPNTCFYLAALRRRSRAANDRGCGPFGLEAGAWIDGSSMAQRLAASPVHWGGFDARDQMNRYVNSWQWDYYSSTGECLNIGIVHPP